MQPMAYYKKPHFMSKNMSIIYKLKEPHVNSSKTKDTPLYYSHKYKEISKIELLCSMGISINNHHAQDGIKEKVPPYQS
jgi:hypothetical protein